MKHFKTQRTMANKQKTGSALLLTLMVVSLLLVIVLSFVVFVRMELRQMVNRQQLIQARFNAKLGAELAISRLQELAGPDTRVTAPMLTASAVQPNKLLIGQAIDAAAYIPTGASLSYNPNYTKTLGYFLSYDSGTAFDINYWPFDASGGVSSGNALLVGPGSTSTSKDDNADGVPDGFVAAPLQDLSDGQSGAYAWWASDEGLKAQINIIDPYLVSTGQENNREQATTAQRNGSEAVLENYVPTNPNHTEILKRSFNLEQLNLISGFELGPEVARDYYHDVTLQSLGLPTNTKRGGLKRDLTAVFKEAETTGGVVNTSAAQFTQLLNYQTDRIARYRAETLALGALGSQPTSLPERFWNALQVLTLRDDQANSLFNDRMFPPMTDMHTQWDLGGALWKQLVSWVTLKQRAETSQGVVAARRWQENMQLSPVIAKVSLANYITVDYPDVGFHWIPTVTLWNPYSVPLVMNPSSPWRVLVDMDDGAILGGYWVRLKVQNSKWSAPNTSNFSHIVPKDELWTPKFKLEWNSKSDANFVFRIRDAAGGTAVVIPPGEAIMFSLHRHKELTPDSSGKIDTVADLTMGLATDGQYSVYVKTDLEDQIFADNAWYDPSRDGPNTSHNNGVDDINEYNSKTYAEAAGGYNEWHTTNTRNRTYETVTTRHLPYPFPLDTNLLAQVSQISSLVKIPPPADLDISINRNGLQGWKILQIGAELGRHAEESANLRDMRLKLDGGNVKWPMVDVLHPNQDLPDAIQAARSYDGDNPWAINGQIITPWDPIKIPADDEPFTPATPQFPAWGFSYGLRLPDHSYVFNATTSQGNSVAAPIRWLQDFNPLFPFPNRDPASRMQNAGGWRNSRRGFKSAPMYVGGFYMGDSLYSDLTWTTPNDLNQYIGDSDDSLPGYGSGERPKATLIEVPEDSKDMVSVASLMHAPLVSTYHALHPNNAAALPGFSIGDTNNKDAVTYTVAYWTGHPGFAQPTYMIGNSESHLLVARERAEQSFYPSTSVSSPTESIPYLTSKGPADMSNASESYLAMYDFSWVYNEVLWDDFFFTSDANSRLQWQGTFTSADRNFTQSAERLLINGAFNINSTSVPAWAVLLESMMDVDLGVDTDTEGFAAFNRFITPPGPAFEKGSDYYRSPSSYNGYRRLSADEIWKKNNPDDTSDDTGLAVEIVRQVRERGPFLSLSDFVNRSLIAEVDDPLDHGRKGALQMAIENAGLNDDMGNSTDDPSWVDGPAEYVDPNSFMELFPGNTTGASNGSAPGMLMQADILARIGSVLQPRSDTFTIRAMGLIGAIENPSARAWCEVTVQRMPDYVDSSANASGDLPATLSPMNIAFGRKFEIIDFRWLSQEEI